MIEFDLEAAKSGKPVQTRDGREARILCFDRKSKHFPIVALLMDYVNNEECLETYTVDGKPRIDQQNDGWKDLVMSPQKVTKFTPVLKNGGKTLATASLYDSWSDVMTDFGNNENLVAIARVEWVG